MTGKTNQNVKKELSEEMFTITDQIKEINDDISSKDIMILEKLFRKFKVDIVEVLAKYKKDMVKKDMLKKDIRKKDMRKKDIRKKDMRKTNTRKRNEINCHLCEKTFSKRSDLENHIKEIHIAQPEFECEQCGNKFVTKWRERKHQRIHNSKVKTSCYYFINDIHCPFDALGCKFLHDLPNRNNMETSEQKTTREEFVDNVAEEASDIVELEITDEAIEEISTIIAAEHHKERITFQTSTPKKFFPCDECLDKSTCTDCIVLHMLGMHGIAKAIGFG